MRSLAALKSIAERATDLGRPQSRIRGVMVRLRFALVCALGVLLLTPQASMGGGWWSYIDVNRSTVATGQRVEVNEAIAFGSVAAAEEAQEAGRFYVYLLRGFDYSVVERAMRKPSPGDWWSLGGAEAIQVGRVTVSVSDANLGRARAAFTVPELPRRTYHLMLCDAGCSEPLADLIPAKGFTVVADRATALTAQRVDRLERRIRTQAGQLAAARADANRAMVASRSARSEVEQLEVEVSSLADEVRRSSGSPPWAYAGWVVAGLLIGALALLALRRHRLRSSPPAGVAAWRPSEAELRDLLSPEPAQPRSRATDARRGCSTGST